METVNNKEKFHHTVGILVRAYFEGTLKHGDCYACAVGNIIRGNGCEMSEETSPQWLMHLKNRFVCHLLYCPNQVLVVKQIGCTGYTEKNLYDIEGAFERSDKGKSEEEWMFNGLMAVVSVLAEIHGIDLETTESAKLLFVK